MQQILKEATDVMVNALLSGEIYRTYRENLEKVKAVPGLKERIDEFRMRNFDIQSNPNIDIDQLDRFEKEFENFRDEKLVSDFLGAELNLCRLIQDVYADIVERIDFQ